MLTKTALAAGLISLISAGTANAGWYRADLISEVLDIPTLSPALGARVLQVENRGFTPYTITIPELTESEQIQNPSNFNGYLSVDIEPTDAGGITNPIPNTITLRHEETNTGYQIATITIAEIYFDNPGEYIAGVTLNSGSIIDMLNSDPFTQTVSFTDDSITFQFQVRDLSPGQIFHFIPDGSIQYHVEIGTRVFDVPEPGALALSAAALAGLGFSARRRQRSA